MAVTKEELEKWAERHGFSKDAFGHYQITDGLTYRLKLSKIAARYEKKIVFSGESEWIKIRSGYYKNLFITLEDKLKGLKA